MEKLNKYCQIGIIALFQLMIIAVAFSGGYLFHEHQIDPDQFPILTQSYGLITNHGLKPFPEPKSAEYGMIRGMLLAYDDPFTTFLDPPQNELQTNQLEGKFGGIGARIEKSENGDFLLFPFPNSPSELAGIKEADKLVGVDDHEITSDLSMDEVLAWVRGAVDSKVKITIRRSSENPTQMIYDIRREEFGLPSVIWNLLPENSLVGYMKVNIIGVNTPDEIEKAILDMQARGAQHYILDLRNNGGGYVDSGVEIARLFLDQGTIIQQESKDQKVISYKVTIPGKYKDIHLVVIINNQTASAAEIVAGSLQAHKRAALVGEQSYGKDSIQLVFTLDDQSSLHVTSAQWWIPGLDNFSSGNGLKPDLTLTTNDTNSNIAIQKAAIYLLQ